MNVIIAILAAWRLTEILTMDRISEPLRKRWPIYLWTCPRCVSVWAGIGVGLLYWRYPLLNLPLAVSETYVLFQLGLNWVNMSLAQAAQAARPQAPAQHPQQLHIGITPTGDIHVIRTDFNSTGVSTILTKVIAAMRQQETRPS